MRKNIEKILQVRNTEGAEKFYTHFKERKLCYHTKAEFTQTEND